MKHQTKVGRLLDVGLCDASDRRQLRKNGAEDGESYHDLFAFELLELEFWEVLVPVCKTLVVVEDGDVLLLVCEADPEEEPGVSTTPPVQSSMYHCWMVVMSVAEHVPSQMPLGVE